MISVLILTKNEEKDLPDCLKSLSWCDDIHVFDSFSEDKTIEIAIKAGAKVTQREFDGYASQRNAALTNINYKYPWIFILDADERVPSILPGIMSKEILKAQEEVCGFRLRRRDFLGNRWLKHSQISSFYIRLVRKGKISYSREINEVIKVEGIVKNIEGFFDHYPFSKGISHWLNKHNKYSSMEAQRFIEEQNTQLKFSLANALFAKDFNLRRFHQKGIFYKLPFRPIIKWIYMIIWKRAFLDGSAGFTYVRLQSIYEYFIVLKTRELLKEYKLKNKF